MYTILTRQSARLRAPASNLSAAPAICGCGLSSYSVASTSAVASSSSSPSAGAESASAAAPSEATTHYRITLRRSAIGLPEQRSLVLASLGLKKRLSSVYMRQDPTAAGKILKVKELVAVQNVRRATAEEAFWVRQNWTDRVRTGLRLDALMAASAPAATASTQRLSSNGLSSEDDLEGEDVWIDENGFVVDAGRQGKKAPRGYRVVGNVLDGTGEQIQV
ncbi:hypothetical protein OC845_003633 [Tilletia horrida]|nr:hypothetical protein OC845_003633 [Tilletia horrida]